MMAFSVMDRKKAYFFMAFFVLQYVSFLPDRVLANGTDQKSCAVARGLLTKPTENDLGKSAWCYMQKEDYPAVVDMTSQAIGINKKSVLFYSLRGEAYLKMGRYQESIDDLIIATRLVPDSIDYPHLLAEAYYSSGNMSSAENSLKPVVEEANSRTWQEPADGVETYSPGEEKIYLLYFDILRAQKKYAEAGKTMEIALRRNNTSLKLFDAYLQFLEDTGGQREITHQLSTRCENWKLKNSKFCLGNKK